MNARYRWHDLRAISCVNARPTERAASDGIRCTATDGRTPGGDARPAKRVDADGVVRLGLDEHRANGNPAVGKDVERGNELVLNNLRIRRPTIEVNENRPPPGFGIGQPPPST